MIFDGQLMVGACVSCTVTVNVQLPSGLLGLLSAAVTVTVVVPTGKKVPEAGLVVTLLTPQLSVADGNVKLTTAPHWLGAFDTMIFAGQLTDGACVS